ncbi:S-layer homology domain-containing protein [Sinanaerobacter sp. ZZT-01]|uniref:S-layer homology domain-containing protein n=1 Tax=Sinanaerobacter sp. ZZT-01 TaxID=3111540 RepID=UPI002D79BDCF|nr:S-layer homology domain-containing protein [Sinanaerobacter sp. ZZT-01]WRR94877.1 S-layer homology domain-containing protein [Sinanaerobacter sp. ZZT-01]
MKKVLSLVLVLTLVLGSFGFAFADTTTTAKTTATPTDVVGTEFEGAVTALSALGVVSGYEDGTYKPANIVTRAEMAKLIIAELGLEANATGSKSTFKDMSGYGWAEGYIGYAQSLGIVSGYGDGTFKPGKTVSYDEALTMIVSALGYTKDCKEMNGSWPAIYVQKARVLGLTDDVKAGGAVGANRGDVAIYLYNMLTADMGYADADGVYQNKKDKDSKNVKVITNLDAEESSDGVEGYSVITKSDADDALVNIKAYIGACAKTFKMTKGKNDGKIIAISDVKSDFITGEFKDADKVIKTADGTEYKLDDIYKNGVEGTSSEKFFKSDYTASEFVNGDTASSRDTTILRDGKTIDTSEDGTFVTIAADLSGKTVKGIYSVAKWSVDNAETVDADDIKAIKSNKSLLGKDFTEDDNDDIDTNSFELVGVKSLNDIKEGHIVYVYTGGSDKEITRVAVGTETVKGEITKKKESTRDNKVTIDGKEYQFAQDKLNKNGITSAEVDADDVDTEDEVEFYLDAYGYIYDYKAISGSADNFAIVLDLSTGNTGRIDEKHQIKLFLADGTDKVFNVDDDLFGSDANDRVSGVTDKNKWDDTLTAGAIVKYGVDKDGVIDSFEDLTIATGKNYDNSKATPNNAPKSDITKSGYYAGREIAKNAVIYTYEEKAENSTSVDSLNKRNDDDKYGVTTLEKVLDSKDIYAAFVTEKGKIVSMLIYDYAASDAIYGVATEYSKTVDSDYEIKMLSNDAKAEKTYKATSKAKGNLVKDYATADANAGMKLMKMKFNANGELSDLVQVWNGTKIIDTDDTMTVGAIEGIQTGDYSYKNRIFEVKTGAAVKGIFENPKYPRVSVDRNATILYNDGKDWKYGTDNKLENLPAGSSVWFYDTKDDNNDDLMDIVVIYKKDDGTTSNPSTGDISMENDQASVEIVTNQSKDDFSGLYVNGNLIEEKVLVITDNRVIISDTTKFTTGDNEVKVYYKSALVTRNVVKKPSTTEIEEQTKVEEYEALALDDDANIKIAVDATAPDLTGVQDGTFKTDLQKRIDAKAALIKKAATVATVVVANVTVDKADASTVNAKATLKNAAGVELDTVLAGTYGVTYAWTVEAVAQGTSDAAVEATTGMLVLANENTDTVTATVTNVAGVDAGDNWTVKVVVDQAGIGTTNTTATVTAK